MQIDGIQSKQNTISHMNGKLEKHDLLKTKQFEDMLETKELKKEKDDTALNEMIDNIDGLKKILDFELTVDNLKKYKEAVQSFLEYYTKNELKMEEYVLRDRKGYQKKLSIIRSIDEKMNNLNENMLESPLGHIETLKKIGEIKGLVVNLLL